MKKMGAVRGRKIEGELVRHGMTIYYDGIERRYHLFLTLANHKHSHAGVDSDPFHFGCIELSGRRKGQKFRGFQSAVNRCKEILKDPITAKGERLKAICPSITK